MVGCAGGECQDLEAVPSEHALRRRKFRLAPITVDRRAVAAALDLDAGEQLPHRARQRRTPFRHADGSARIRDAGERMRQDDAGIGEQAAPVAGMVRAFAQIDHEVDHVGATGAEKKRRPVGRDARAVRRDQQVRVEEPARVLRAKFAQPGRADLLAHLHQNLHVEPQG
jgi:hypothetical protein